MITETFLDRTTIERKIIDRNHQYYKKVMNTNAYNDKIYNMLQNNTIRNKILSRNLQESNCDNAEVFEFLQLLKDLNFNITNTNHNEITIDEWINVVKKAKKWSVSSIFSSRIYSVYKYSLAS